VNEYFTQGVTGVTGVTQKIKISQETLSWKKFEKSVTPCHTCHTLSKI
jgi:hypothetical protein